MKKRKLIVTGSLAATLLLTGSRATLADTTGKTRVDNDRYQSQTSLRLNYEPGTGPKLNTIAQEFGINTDDFREELRSGMTPRQILQDQGFSSSQIHKILRTSTHSSKRTITPGD